MKLRPLMIAILACALSFAAGPAFAADRVNVDDYLAKVMTDEAVAASLPPEAALVQIWKNTGKFSGVEDADFKALSEEFLTLYKPKYVPRLREAFAQHFVATFSNEDLSLMLACNVGGDCAAAQANAELVAKAGALGSFGQREGTRIGSEIGAEITPELIAIVEANESGRFDNTQALVAGLRAGAAQ